MRHAVASARPGVAGRAVLLGMAAIGLLFVVGGVTLTCAMRRALHAAPAQSPDGALQLVLLANHRPGDAGLIRIEVRDTRGAVRYRDSVATTESDRWTPRWDSNRRFTLTGPRTLAWELEPGQGGTFRRVDPDETPSTAPTDAPR